MNKLSIHFRKTFPIQLPNTTYHSTHLQQIEYAKVTWGAVSRTAAMVVLDSPCHFCLQTLRPHDTLQQQVRTCNTDIQEYQRPRTITSKNTTCVIVILHSSQSPKTGNSTECGRPQDNSCKSHIAFNQRIYCTKVFTAPQAKYDMRGR